MGIRNKVVFEGFKEMKLVKISKRLFITIQCFLIKIAVFFAIIFGLNPKNKNKKVQNLIVSFTSYGVRLKKCTWLAVYSMFMQSIQPEFVVLYLEETLKEQKLPFLLRKLQKIGLQIEYADNIRSYKKLVPALHQFPEKTIITIDDDIYYSKHLIKNLVETSKDNLRAICATVTRGITFDNAGTINSYNDWQRNPTQEDLLFAVGYGGILYPPSVFNLNYMKKDDFMVVSPNADDIWFFAARYKDSIPLLHANRYNITYYPVNYIYERFHKNEGLTEENVFGGKNDVQMKATLEHFKIDLIRSS